MLTDDERALLQHYLPLIDAELQRLGLSESDRRWIFAGSDQQPTREGAEAQLAELRALPSDMGPVAFCAWLGFDYATRKRELESPSPDPME